MFVSCLSWLYARICGSEPIQKTEVIEPGFFGQFFHDAGKPTPVNACAIWMRSISERYLVTLKEVVKVYEIEDPEKISLHFNLNLLFSVILTIFTFFIFINFVKMTFR